MTDLLRRWRMYFRWSEYHRRSVAYRRNKRAGRRPPICYFWTGGCYCDLMPPAQLCSVCIQQDKRTPVPPCMQGLLPHKWRRYRSQINSGRLRVGTRMRQCDRCYKTQVRSGGWQPLGAGS